MNWTKEYSEELGRTVWLSAVSLQTMEALGVSMEVKTVKDKTVKDKTVKNKLLKGKNEEDNNQIVVGSHEMPKRVSLTLDQIKEMIKTKGKFYTALQTYQTEHDSVYLRLFSLLDRHFQDKGLCNLFTRELIKQLEKDLLLSTKDLLKHMSGYYNKLLADYKVEKEKPRGSYRIKDVLNLLDRFKPTSYLDFGCSNGDITQYIGKFYEIKKENIHGIDTYNVEEKSSGAIKINSGMTFTLNKDVKGKLQYRDNQFDFITAFMVLHHVDPAQLSHQLKELYRVLSPDGYLFIREHNIPDRNEVDRLYANVILDILHLLYDYVWEVDYIWEDSKDNSVFEESTGHYKSKYEMNKLLESAGFKLHRESKNPTHPVNNPLFVYTAVYKK